MCSRGASKAAAKLTALERGEERRETEEPQHEICSAQSSYMTAFVSTLSFAVVTLPALPLRVGHLCLAEGSSPSVAAYTVGIILALRYIAEFAGSQLLSASLTNFGRQATLVVSNTVCVIEYAVMALATSPLTFGASHVLGGLFHAGASWESLFATEGATERATARACALACLGAASTLGPLISGSLVTQFGEAMPFVCTHLACFASLVLGQVFVAARPLRAKPAAPKPLASLAALRRLLAGSHELRWYSAALVLNSVGVAAFGAVVVQWGRGAFGWDAQDIGRFLALGGLLHLVSNNLVLPCLVAGTRVVAGARGSESLAAQLCLAVSAARFLALTMVADASSAHVLLLLTAVGSCSTPLLSNLCQQQVPKSQLLVWEAAGPVLTAAGSAAGALLGSALLAAKHGELSLSAPLCFAGACHFFAGAVASHGAVVQPDNSWMRHYGACVAPAVRPAALRALATVQPDNSWARHYGA